MAFNIFKNAIKNGEQVKLFNKGKNKRDLVCVDDVVKAIIFIIKSNKRYNHEIFNVGSGKSISNKEYYKLIKKLVSPKSKIKPILMDRNYMESTKTKGNIKKMKEFFGWEPTIKVRDKIKEFCE
jgi:nucleoside-diphosphate-sugar epimerase